MPESLGESVPCCPLSHNSEVLNSKNLVVWHLHTCGLWVCPISCHLSLFPTCNIQWHNLRIIGICHLELCMLYIREGNDCLGLLSWTGTVTGQRLGIGLGSRRNINSEFGTGYCYTPPLGSPSCQWPWFMHCGLSIVFCVIHNLQPVCKQVALD